MKRWGRGEYRFQHQTKVRKKQVGEGCFQESGKRGASRFLVKKPTTTGKALAGGGYPKKEKMEEAASLKSKQTKGGPIACSM